MSLYNFACYVAILLVIIVFLLRRCHGSYSTYLNCFLNNTERKPQKKLYYLFRAYSLMGLILAGSLTFIETDFAKVTIETCFHSFHSFFLSSCSFLFIARLYTTTKLVSTKPKMESVAHYINTLAINQY